MTANVERLRVLLAAGTQGPWRSHKAAVLMGMPTAGGFDISCCPRPHENAELIAAAVNALPTLLHQLAERDAALEREQGVREDAQRQRRAAERAREEAERDALRYRWVRACDRKGELAIHVDTMCEGELLGMEQLDAAIDAFLAASGGA